MCVYVCIFTSLPAAKGFAYEVHWLTLWSFHVINSFFFHLWAAYLFNFSSFHCFWHYCLVDCGAHTIVVFAGVTYQVVVLSYSTKVVLICLLQISLFSCGFYAYSGFLNHYVTHNMFARGSISYNACTSFIYCTYLGHEGLHMPLFWSS